jgi:hypothetical protein
MGSSAHLQWMQHRGTRLFRLVFCVMANNDGKAEKICYIVRFTTLLFWPMLCRNIPSSSETPRSKMARCRYPSGVH